MRKPRSKDEVVVKLRQHIDAAETLRPLLEHPAFSGFFNAEKADLIAEMVNAKPTDDATRRDAAMRLATLEKFRTHLINVLTAGERAARGIKEIEDKANAN